MTKFKYFFKIPEFTGKFVTSNYAKCGKLNHKCLMYVYKDVNEFLQFIFDLCLVKLVR